MHSLCLSDLNDDILFLVAKHLDITSLANLCQGNLRLCSGIAPIIFSNVHLVDRDLTKLQVLRDLLNWNHHLGNYCTKLKVGNGPQSHNRLKYTEPQYDTVFEIVAKFYCVQELKFHYGNVSITDMETYSYKTPRVAEAEKMINSGFKAGHWKRVTKLTMHVECLVRWWVPTKFITWMRKLQDFRVHCHGVLQLLEHQQNQATFTSLHLKFKPVPEKYEEAMRWSRKLQTLNLEFYSHPPACLEQYLTGLRNLKAARVICGPEENFAHTLPVPPVPDYLLGPLKGVSIPDLRGCPRLESVLLQRWIPKELSSQTIMEMCEQFFGAPSLKTFVWDLSVGTTEGIERLHKLMS